MNVHRPHARLRAQASRILLLSTLVAAVAATPVRAQPCRAPDETTARLVARLKEASAATGTEAEEDRALFGIPAVPDSTIGVVTDAVTCARVAQAVGDLFVAHGYTRPSITSLYVVRLGPRFVAHEPSLGQAGEFRTFYIFDGTFAPSGGWTGP